MTDSNAAATPVSPASVPPSCTDLANSDSRPRVSSGWIARYGLMYLGQNIAWAAPATLLLANQVMTWYPDLGEKEKMYSLLMGAGGIVGIFASPAAGILSDATRSRLGRRPPWIISGTILASLALAMIAFSGWKFPQNPAIGFPLVVGAWVFFQFVIALVITPTQAIAPDRVSKTQFGMVSGVMGMTYTVAVVLGTALGTLMPGVRAYPLVIALLLASMVPFLWIDREQPYQENPHGSVTAIPPDSAAVRSAERVNKSSRINWRTIAPHPFRYPDFWWMFVTRTLLTLAQAIALFYLLYFLKDRIGYSNPDWGVLILTGIFALCVVINAMLSGWLSDKLARRKPFVALASVGVGLACVLMAIATSFSLVIVAAAVLGLSWGVYQAIDQALVNEVLPSAKERGTHMGVMNLAVALPNMLAPILAAAALLYLKGYPGVYLMAAGMALVGGLTVLRIRSAR